MAERLVMGRGGLAVARGREVSLYRVDDGAARLAHRVDAEVEVQRLHVAAGGDAALFGDRDRVWCWTAAGGTRLLATRAGPREHFAVGFAGVDDTVVLLAQKGALTATDLGGGPRFTAELRSPRSLYAERVVELPAGFLALHGAEFSDPFDTVVVVELAALAGDAQRVQAALADRRPLVDRAPRLIVGPGPGSSAVVFRDPEAEEAHDPDDDPDELPDVWGLRGFYLRDLHSGALIRRVGFDGPVEPGAELMATAHGFVLTSASAVQVLDRSGRLAWSRSCRALGLDARSGRLAVLDEAGGISIGALPEP